MSDETDALILDLVEWVAARPCTYSDVMDAWRTSCPRLPVWEDAVDLGLVARTHEKKRGAIVKVTALGRDLLAKHFPDNPQFVANSSHTPPPMEEISLCGHPTALI